jgi:glycerol-3-phosphate O-acyltransferase
METPLREKYGKYFTLMKKLSRAAEKIDETKVYEPANPDTRKIMYSMLEENLLPGSRLEGIENFKVFYDAVKSGQHGLILMEHYSNMDLPAIVYLLEKYGEDWARDLSSRIVAIAGMKLNEANPMVRAWAEGFTRVVIYPTRSLDKVENQENLSTKAKEEEEKRARKINLAAMRAMDQCKHRGEVILVFPSGTRFRPGHPETKKGLREIDSYLRMFNKMILVSINGCCLRINPADTEDMLSDLVAQDKVIMTASPVLDCKQFRKNILTNLPQDDPDPKQKVIDHVMDILNAQHDEIEKTRFN